MHAIAAAVMAGRPPPPFELYCTAPSFIVHLRMYCTALSMISFGTGMPALRQPRSPCTWVMVGRSFVEVTAVFGTYVAPAARLGLCSAGELDGPREHPDQFLASVGVLLFAQDLGEEEHRKAVAVGVAVVVGVANEPVRSTPASEEIDRPADVLGIFPLGGRGTFAEHRHARQAGHRRRVAPLGGPVPQFVLLIGEPIEPSANGLSHLGITRFCPSGCSRSIQHYNARDCKHKQRRKPIPSPVSQRIEVGLHACDYVFTVLVFANRQTGLVACGFADSDQSPPIRRKIPSRPREELESADSTSAIAGGWGGRRASVNFSRIVRVVISTVTSWVEASAACARQ